MKKKLFAILIAAMLCSVAGLTACGTAKNTEPEEDAIALNTIKYIDDMSSLARGCAYVETPTEDGQGVRYASPYWGNTTFSTSSYTSSSSSKVAWFNDDNWDLIPTIYKGQHVVYRTNQEFNETFYFERFIDSGYSFGLCNLSRTSTGRYKVSTAANNTSQINMGSDAAKLTEFDGVNVIIEAIGGLKLRAGMISPCGAITGLEKDGQYDCDIYVGTEINARRLKADSRLLYSVQVNSTSEYEFVQAEIIEIEIPEYFHSGYYSMNGTGLFRYIDAEPGTPESEYDENTDFNILNVIVENSEEDYNPAADFYYNEVVDRITIPTDGNYSLDVSYDDNINAELLPDGMSIEDIGAPTAILHFEFEDVELFDIGDNTLTNTFYATAGTYELEVIDTYGRGHYDLLLYLDGTLEADTGADDDADAFDDDYYSIFGMDDRDDTSGIYDYTDGDDNTDEEGSLNDDFVFDDDDYDEEYNDGEALSLEELEDILGTDLNNDGLIASTLPTSETTDEAPDATGE